MKAEFVQSLSHMKDRDYWNKANTVEFLAFGAKLVIIIPGLLFGLQWWWLYIFAFATSASLVWTSTVKTLPTIILFNIAWMVLASTAILDHFLQFLPN